jgi:hypothetical protein
MRAERDGWAGGLLQLGLKEKKERSGETGLSQKKRERRSGRLRREKERRERFRVFLRL